MKKVFATILVTLPYITQTTPPHLSPVIAGKTIRSQTALEKDKELSRLAHTHSVTPEKLQELLNAGADKNMYICYVIDNRSPQPCYSFISLLTAAKTNLLAATEKENKACWLILEKHGASHAPELFMDF